MKAPPAKTITPLATLIIISFSSTVKVATSTFIPYAKSEAERIEHRPDLQNLALLSPRSSLNLHHLLFPRTLASTSPSSYPPPNHNQLTNLNNPILNRDQDVNYPITFPTVIEIILETVPDDYTYDEDSEEYDNDDDENNDERNDNNNDNNTPPSSSTSEDSDIFQDTPQSDPPINNPPGPFDADEPSDVNAGAGPGMITIKIPLNESPPSPSQQHHGKPNANANTNTNYNDDDNNNQNRNNDNDNDKNYSNTQLTPAEKPSQNNRKSTVTLDRAFTVRAARLATDTYEQLIEYKKRLRDVKRQRQQQRQQQQPQQQDGYPKTFVAHDVLCYITTTDDSGGGIFGRIFGGSGGEDDDDDKEIRYIPFELPEDDDDDDDDDSGEETVEVASVTCSVLWTKI